MTEPPEYRRLVVFEGPRRIAEGPPALANAAARRALETASAAVLMFDAETGRQVDVEMREPPPEPARRGRPRLGVVSREVTLMPDQWAWLATQRGGASVALRRLIEAARKDSAEADRQAARRDAAYRFMSAMAGDLVDFEEASRALFAGERARLGRLMAPWPDDVAGQVLRLLDGE